jgi:hypothetical protein
MTEQASASVIVVRPRTLWRDRGRSYKLLIDGQICGEIRPGRELSIEVSAGHHVAQAQISWTGSPPLAFDVAAGETVRLRVQPATDGTPLQQALSQDRYLTLHLEQP